MHARKLSQQQTYTRAHSTSADLLPWLTHLLLTHLLPSPAPLAIQPPISSSSLEKFNVRTPLHPPDSNTSSTPTLPAPPFGNRFSTHKHARTCPQGHVHRPKLIRRAPDAQLAVAVAAPALDGAPGHERARVLSSQDDGGGGDAWACARAR
jgi:hypothetical protein